MVTRRESLIREGILNPDGSRKGDRDRFPKLIAEGILPGGGFGISPPANTQLGQPRPVLQPPMTSVSGGVNSFPNAFDPGSQLGNGTIRTGINPGGQFVQPGFGGARGIRTADFIDSNNDGIDDRDQGFQNLPGANQGINLPINIGNNPSLPNTRFGAGVRRIVDPSVQPTLIQDQMFQPPMQQPVQNQMPVANSFLEQLQQSAGLLQNQVTALQPPVVNNVPQNRFVGNQFQMPFGMGQPTPFGGNYGSGGFNLPYNPGSYTPGRFNQYGNIGTTAGIDNIISSLLGPGADRGGEGDSGGMFGGVQGQNDPSNPSNRQDRYDKNPDGTITQYDASTGLTTTYDLDDEGLTLAQQLFGNIAKVPTTASLVESAIGGLLGNLTDTGFSVNSNMPTTNLLDNPTNNPLIANYNQLITEKIPLLGLPEVPLNIPEVDLSLPTGLLTGVDQGPTNEFGRTQAEQDAVNASIEQGNFVGYGQNEDGDFAGVVTGGPNNSPVTTGYGINTPSINNPNAVAAIAANAARDRNRDRGGPGDSNAPGGSVAAGPNRGGPPGARS